MRRPSTVLREVPALLSFALAVLGVVPLPIATVAPAQAQAPECPGWYWYNQALQTCVLCPGTYNFDFQNNVCYDAWNPSNVAPPLTAPPLTPAPEPPPPPPTPAPAPTPSPSPSPTPEAPSCTPPQFWNTWDERCDIYLCAAGWTLSGSGCTRDSDGFWVPAAQCEIGSGVAGDGQGMRCVDASSPSTIVRAPAPPGTIRPADPPDATVRATYTLPFTVSESGAAETSYEFSVASTTEVSVSLSGMNRDIDCSVNGSRCTNRGGTANDSWSGTLGAGTHAVSVYPYGGGTGNWTLSVSGTSTSPPPAPTPPPSPPGSPTPTCPTGYTYVAAESRCERSQAFRMQAIETGISSQQSYSFTLRSSSNVTVSLTGLTRDFDCRVKYSDCTNNWGSEDDSWSGTLGAGTHTVLVYPYGGGGPGDYTLTVTVNDVNLVSVVSPTGSGPEEIVCKDGDGNEIACPTPDQVLVVLGEDPGPPPGAGPGEGDPPPGGTPDPGDGGGGTTPPDEAGGLIGSLAEAVVDNIDCRGMNFSENDRLGTDHGGTNSIRPAHGGVDIETKGVRSFFRSITSGNLSYHTQYVDHDDDANTPETVGGCGHYAKIERDDGSYTFYCHLDPAFHVDPGHVDAGTVIGKDGETGNAQGPHLHVGYRDANGNRREIFDLFGGEEGMAPQGFTFDDEDPAFCEEE